MLTLFRTLGLRALSKRWGRSLLVTLSIALGVATLVSSQLLNGTITAAVTDSLQPLKGVAELTVANGDAGVRRDLAARLRKVSGVKAALPLVVERVTLPDADNRSVVLLGVEVPTDAPPADDNPFGVRVKLDLAMAALARVFGRRPAVAGSELAALLPGGPLKVRAGNKVHNLDVVGTVSAEGPAASLGKLLLVVDAGDAAEMFGRPGYVQRIDVFLEPGTDRQAAREALQAAVGDSARVETPDEQGRASSEVMTGVKVGFGLCGAGALVVGMFLVYNALSVTVAERRREIGILRSVGATRRQIAVLFASEAAVLGVIGAALGVPLGWALARGLLPLIQWVMRELNVGGEIGLDMTPGLAVVAVAAGVAVALLAALVPSLQAAGDEPADAVRRAPGGGAWLFQVAQPAVAVLLVLAGGGMVLARGWLPRHTGHYGGMVLALVGMLLATPVLASLLARLLRPLVRAVFGIEARLAADNLLRSPGRTGLVIGALAAGVAMVLQVAGVAQAIERPVLAWVDRSILADLFVKCGTAGAYFPMDEDAAGRLRATEGVRHVFGVRSRLLPYHYTSVLVVALDADVYLKATRERGPFEELEQFALLAEPGTALASENFARLHGVGVGDVVELPGIRLRVVGVVPDYSWNRGTLVTDRLTTYVAAFGDPTADVFDVFVEPETTPARVKTAIEAGGTDLALGVLDRAEVHDLIVNVIRRPFSLALAQQAVLGLVAALGVVTALLISVLQRRRELGLLRAVGATRGQVVRTVLAEAMLMGLIGTALGVLVGLPLEWYVVRLVISEESGFAFPMAFPWSEGLVVGAAAVGLATLAGLLPALQAGRLNVVDAIAYE